MNNVKKIVVSSLVVIVAVLAIVSFLPRAIFPVAYAGDASQGASSNQAQVNQLESNQQKLVTAVPMPQLTNSLERQNIANRAKLFDSPDKISYIYLVSFGKVMAYYTVKGKVSSLNSYMSPQEEVVNGDGSPCNNYDSTYQCYIVQAPDIDGSYGQNANGIFFFTTSGIYVEWSGDYLMADQPLSLLTPPELIMQVK